MTLVENLSLPLSLGYTRHVSSIEDETGVLVTLVIFPALIYFNKNACR